MHSKVVAAKWLLKFADWFKSYKCFNFFICVSFCKPVTQLSYSVERNRNSMKLYVGVVSLDE